MAGLCVAQHPERNPRVRTFSVLGDSISTFEGTVPEGFAVYYDGERARAAGVIQPSDTWWHQVASHFGARILANGSFSGSMVEGAGFPAAWSSRRIAALTGPGGEAPTDILVFVGTNDYGWGGAANQAAGGSAAAPAQSLPCAPSSISVAVGEPELRGFSRAYARMLDRLADAYAGSTLWCLTLPTGRVRGAAGPTFTANLRGVPLAAYNAAIARVVEDGPSTTRLVDLQLYGRDYETVDGTHPTVRGMGQLSALAIAAMEGRTEPDEAQFSGGDLWRSHELCEGRSCVGCASAHNTGAIWTCVCDRALAGETP